MDYDEYPVPDMLQRFIRCIWRLKDDEPGGSPQTIYPDGQCELIVHLGPPPECWDAVAGWHRQASSLFAAQRVTAVRLRATQPLDCLGVRLRPAASALLGARALEAHRDRIADLAGIDRALSRSLRAAMRNFARGDDANLWRLLARICARHSLDARIESATARLESSAGKARIDAAARAAGMSIRGFQIRFRQCVGTTPEEFARLMRLQATLRALDGDTSLSELAADTGFSDQAHATRELRRVTGLTPARLRMELRRDREGDAAVQLAAAFVRGHAAASGR
jgi:AraC-like DNA-binding protein